MSFEKISKKKFFSSVRSETEAHLRTAKKLLYSVRKFPTVPDTFRVLSRFFEISRYPVEPVKAPHGFPLDRITLFCRKCNQGKVSIARKCSQGFKGGDFRRKYYPSLDGMRGHILAARGMEAVFFRSSCPTASKIRVQGRCSCWGFGGKAPKVCFFVKNTFLQ